MTELMKSLSDYDAEYLNRIAEALRPDEVENAHLEEDIAKMLATLQYTADYESALEMVQWVMAQAMTDMAYNKGVGVSNRLYEVVKELQEAAEEADGTEFYEARIDKLKWKESNLRSQQFYWRRFFSAARTNYRKTTLVMQQGGSYENLPADWEPPEKRYHRYEVHQRLTATRPKESAGKLLAMTTTH